MSNPLPEKAAKAQCHAVTFYKVNVKSLEAVMRANNTAIQVLCKSGINVDRNDVGGVNYSNSTGIRVPHLGIKALLSVSPNRNTWLEAADIATDLYVDIYAAHKEYREHIERRRAFVSEQDKLTDRVARLLGQIERSVSGAVFLGLSDHQKQVERCIGMEFTFLSRDFRIREFGSFSLYHENLHIKGVLLLQTVFLVLRLS